MVSKKATFVMGMAVWLVAFTLLAGCGTQTNNSTNANDSGASQSDADQNNTARTITHEMGDAKIEGTPERIVVLEFSFVDALAAAGIAPVGIADDGKPDIFIDEIASVIGDYTSVGTRKQPSIEVITSLEPDLIIADLNRHKEIYDELQEIAPTIVLKSLESSYEENLDSFKVIMEAVAANETKEERLQKHNERMDELISQVDENEDRTVLPAVVTNDLFNAHASNSYTGELLEKLGFENAIQQEEAYAKLNLEQLVEINPDIIFVMAAGEQTLIDVWGENPLWQNISAVKNDQVFHVNRNLWSKFRGLIAGEAIAEEAIEKIYNQ